MKEIGKDDVVVLSTDCSLKKEQREALAAVLKEAGIKSVLLEMGLKVEAVIKA